MTIIALYLIGVLIVFGLVYTNDEMWDEAVPWDPRPITAEERVMFSLSIAIMWPMLAVLFVVALVLAP